MQLAPVQAARVPDASVWSTAANILKVFGIMTISKLLVLIFSRLDRAERECSHSVDAGLQTQKHPGGRQAQRWKFAAAGFCSWPRVSSQCFSRHCTLESSFSNSLLKCLTANFVLHANCRS